MIATPKLKARAEAVLLTLSHNEIATIVFALKETRKRPSGAARLGLAELEEFMTYCLYRRAEIVEASSLFDSHIETIKQQEQEAKNGNAEAEKLGDAK